jgi:hypothetical protein
MSDTCTRRHCCPVLAKENRNTLPVDASAGAVGSFGSEFNHVWMTHVPRLRVPGFVRLAVVEVFAE